MKTAKNTKTIKILPLALILALLMALAQPMGVFAAGEGATLTIKVQKDRIALSEDDYSAYKLFDLAVSTNSEGGTNYAYTPVQPQVNSFLAWATAKYGAPSPYGADAAAFKAWLDGRPADAEMKSLIDDLYASGAFAPTGTATKAENEKDIEIGGLDYGYYLVVGEGETEQGGGKAIVRYSLVTVSEGDALIKLKADVPWLEKFVSDDNLGYGSEDWAKDTDVSRGDTVYFMIRSNVPDMTGYDDYTFIVHDTMNAAFAFNSGSVAVKLVDRDGEEADIPLSVFTDYTVSSERIYANGGSGGQIIGTYVKIDFKDFENYRYYADWDIVIAYNAKFGMAGEYAPAPNPNEAYVEYSNDPYTGGTGNTPEDIVNVYTFNLQVYKIDGKTNELLDGAAFELRTEAGNPDSAVKVTLMAPGAGGLPNIYYVDDSSTETEIEVIGNGGQAGLPGYTIGAASLDGAHISGLKQGTYYLYEKQAPDGYNRMEGEKPVTISHIIVNGESAYEEQVVYVENSAGARLPDTGGAGTSFIYISGALLAIGIAIFLISRRKRNLLDA